MAITTVIAIYFLIWWITLFAVLPFGVRSQHEGEAYAPGTDPGAPMASRIGWKLLWTTLISAAIFGVLYYLYNANLIPFDWLAELGRPPKR